MSKIAKLLIVINPKSGGMDKNDLKRTIRNMAEEKAKEHFFYETTGDNDLEKLKKIYKEFYPSRVLVVGGDGTVNLVASSLLGKNIVMAILPTGSANGLARELKISEIEKEALTVAFGAKTQRIDAVEIKDYGFCFHLCDIGLNATLIKNYCESNEHGFYSYIKNSFKCIRSQNSFRATLMNGNIIRKKSVFMVMIANATMFGTGIEINTAGKVNDGKFEVLLLKKINIRRFIQIMLGKRSLLQTIQTDAIKIQTDKKMRFQIDGEYMGDVNEISVQIVPQAIAIAV
jgi:diacylglycerol kinase family enzyme